MLITRDEWIQTELLPTPDPDFFKKIFFYEKYPGLGQAMFAEFRGMTISYPFLLYKPYILWNFWSFRNTQGIEYHDWKRTFVFNPSDFNFIGANLYIPLF